MTTDRDPQVAALLAVLEPEPPAPASGWSSRSACAPSLPLPSSCTASPGPARPAASSPPGAAASSSAWAAAVAVVAAIAGSLALRDDGRERGETVPARPGPSTPQSLPGTATPGVTFAPDSPYAIAMQGADAWLQSVVDDDRELGWALLGQQSRDQLGSEAAYGALDLQAAWGSYLDSPDRSELVLPLGGDLWAVVLTVTSEADVVPPRVIVVEAPPASEYSIEVFLPGPALGLIGTQLGGAPLPRESTIPVSVDADASTYLVIVDGIVFDGATTDGPEDADHLRWLQRDATGAVTGVRPEPALSDGLHWVTVVEIVEGTLAADARVFEVGG